MKDMRQTTKCDGGSSKTGALLQFSVIVVPYYKHSRNIWDAKCAWWPKK